MKVSDYISYLNTRLGQNPFWLKEDMEISAATMDSRRVVRGAVFCAVKGAKADGHDFIRAVVDAGAALVVCERELPTELAKAVSWIRVPNGYHAMALVAEMAADFPAAKMRFYGITGTNGKTTSAYLLRNILRKDPARKVGMVGTIVYDTGGREIAADRTTPSPFELQGLLAEMRRNGVTDVVMEVSSHAIDQRRTGSIMFDACLFTNLTQDHLDYHHTMEEYYLCKRRLFIEMARPNAVEVVNLDDAWGRRLAGDCMANGRGGRVTFGEAEDAAVQCFPEGNGRLSMHFKAEGGELALCTPMPGDYNVRNVAGVAALAVSMGIPKDDITQAVAAFTGAPGRLQPVELPNGAMAYVDYAHTDDAISKAISALRPICKGRLVIVFGCGGDRDRTKRPKMAVAAAKADRVIVTSDNPRTEDTAAIIADILPGFPPSCKPVVVPGRREAIHTAVAGLASDDMLLVAGKGHEDYQEINGVKHHFSDAEVIAEAAALCR